MLKRIRSMWLAGGGAVALAVTLSGVVAAATILTAVVAPAPVAPTVVVDTTATFEDLDGNGIDDDCQTTVVADEVAAASAEAAADLDGDGTISVTEAARSGRVGGKNCNHGGYVSNVANAACDTAAAPASSTAPEADSGDSTTAASGDPADETTDENVDENTDQNVDENSDESGDTATDCTATEPAADEAPAVCVTTPVVPVVEPSAAIVVDEAPNAHGKSVSKVAQSDAIGGKNCNHGGAVSEAAHKDKDAARAAREAAKAARDAAREARREAREAARAAKHHGKPGG
jgi:hypothetical protein